jgi:tricorn protease
MPTNGHQRQHGSQGYVRFPTIFGDRIVFTAEDDLWSVGAAGGRAERLTAGVAEALQPRFSPDGQRIAFIGRDEGPSEVYVMPAAGGPATRLTYHGLAQAGSAGWMPDGSAILYSSAAGNATLGMRMLRRVAPDGGEPTTLPYGIARSIAFGPHGALVIGRHTTEPAYWKRYRGGTAGFLWIDASGSGEFTRLLDLDANIAAPCWVGERVYFIADHEGTGCVYSCLPTGEDLRRHTRQRDYYARNLTTDGQRLVYHAGGDLFLLEPNATTATRLEVALASGRAQRARKFVPAARHLETASAHPQGHSVALTTRGKVFSLGNWEGAVAQHGAADGVRYRLAAWLADGKRLAAVRDDGTEPRLAILTADGAAPERVLDGLDIGHVLELRPAPVGELVALRNHRNEFVVVDAAAGTLKVLDHSPFGREEDLNRMHGLAWSPDAQWLAYAFRINNRQTAIKLAHVATGATHQVTEPVLNDVEPAFDPAGRYLYFIGAREFDPVTDNSQFEWSFPRTMRPYLVTLRSDLRSPFTPAPEAPKDELSVKLETAKEDERKEEQGRPPEVTIDLPGITTRVVAFPVEEGRYGQVQGTHTGAVFTSFPVTGERNKVSTSGHAANNGLLEGYHFETHKTEELVEGVNEFTVTADGKTLLYRSGERLRSIKAGEKPQGEGDRAGRESGWIDLQRVKVSVRPESEWRQMFGEVWRLQREQFWVADMGGADWPAIYRRYAPLVERIGSRGELSDLIWEMQGELGSSHAYEGGGEYRPRPEYAQGYLGVDWHHDAASGRYTIARILRGDPWDAKATSPLLAPGINAAVGDAVLAINGQPVGNGVSPQQLLVNQAEVEAQLLLRPAPGGEPRTVTVRTLASEQRARYLDWVAANRQRVREASGGKLGYIHLINMSFDGFADFHRQFLTEYDYDGLVVDVRWNGGGMVSGLLLEKLARRRVGYDFQRWGQPTPYFRESPRGPMVAITDENAGSDGDIFSHVWKMLELGPLIGKRTWGGVVGIDPYIALVDGGQTTQPEFSFWFADVGWGVENHGTDPTIEVEYPPQAYAAGSDPQLERGIAEALRLVAEHPAPTPTPTPRPHWAPKER